MMFNERHKVFFFVGAAVFLVVLGIVSLQLYQSNNSKPPKSNSPPQQVPATPQHGTRSVIPQTPILSDDSIIPLDQPVTTRVADTTKLPLLSFDHTKSFEENLERFRLFCDSDKDPQSLEARVRSFVKELVKMSETNGAAIKAALLSKQGHPLYRNMLLACLLHSQVVDKQDVVWDIALDQTEDPSVRRTATYVLKELPEVVSQPQQMLRLLADSDNQVKVFALQSAAMHMDEDVFQVTQNLASTSDDIHVRLAAISTIGQTITADKNPYLTDLITQQRTSAEDEFSEASLIKRAAIAALDVSSPDAYAIAQNIAEDIAEDSGVRRRAILTCANVPRPDTLEMITTILQNSDASDAIITKACVQGLLMLGDSTAINIVQNKLTQTKDPEIRALINQLLINHTKQQEE